MHIEDDGTHTYSHTSLSLWRLCKRRWFNRYVLHTKEPFGIAAAWSVHMVHKAIEQAQGSASLDDTTWENLFRAFRAEIGDHDLEDSLHTVGTGKRILERLRSPGPGLDDIASEPQIFLPLLPGARFQSRPDQVGSRDGQRFTVDFKYTEKAWKTPKEPWPVKPLLAYDDQLLGQAICAQADGFIRGTISVEPKSGKLHGPIYEERLADGRLREEWLAETKATVSEIEMWLTELERIDPCKPWPKNEDACYAFGRPCPYQLACKTGWQCESKQLPIAIRERAKKPHSVA